VARQAHELGHEDAYRVRARRYLQVQQILYRQTIAVLHVHVGEVVEPVGQGDDGRIHPVLGELLLAAVQIAHDGIAAHDRLPVELQDEAQEAVHRRVLRAHVQVNRLEGELVPHVRVR
jgi:hypothetical protein